MTEAKTLRQKLGPADGGETEMSKAEISEALWPKRSKYNVDTSGAGKEKRTRDGIVFGSEAEANHYSHLKGLQRAGKISRLQCHPTFTFIVSGVTVGKYTPDFSYHDERDRVVVEDVKGWKKSPKTGKLLPRVNREFSFQRRLMVACFGLAVKLV